MIVYASRTGNVESVIKELKLPSVSIVDNMKLDNDFVLFTYTDGLGDIPNVVQSFLSLNHNKCKGVIASGNTNFGINNFCGSADKINELYGIPIIHKIELRGFRKDYDLIIKKYKELNIDSK